jgi:hypothetical protein
LVDKIVHKISASYRQAPHYFRAYTHHSDAYPYRGSVGATTSFDFSPQLFGDATSVRSIYVIEDNHKLVASPTTEDIVRATVLFYGCGNVLQQTITLGMAQGIIDALEVVEVQKQEINPSGLPSLKTRKKPNAVFFPTASVPKTRERVLK